VAFFAQNIRRIATASAANSVQSLNIFSSRVRRAMRLRVQRFNGVRRAKYPAHCNSERR